MSETNMRKVHENIKGDLLALAHVITDLRDVEEQFKEETLFPHMYDDVRQVRSGLQLAARRLREINQEYGLHADAREPAGPDALGGTKVIDQPVSPATSPQENPR
jgi:hypothetical protein